MIGKTLYRIKFDSATNANFFVNSNFNDLKIRPFIPFTYIYSYGVIRGIPPSFTDEAILNDIVSDVPVNSVHRFTKKVTSEDNKIIFEPTYRVKIGFKGNKIPEEIKLNYALLKVDVYFPPVRQCNKCGRFGHTLKSCRSKDRCLKCTAFECNGNCTQKKCLLCGDNSHNAKDRNL